MIIRPRATLVLPLLALAMTLAMAASVQAQDGRYQSNGTSASLQISFGNTPHWTGVRGTRVQQIRENERPGYDMFRYGGRYYVYQNNHWYNSRRVRGQYGMMEDRNVPRELTRVPRNQWHSYPTAWTDQNGNSRYDNRGQHR